MHSSISIRAKYLFFLLLVVKELKLKEFNIRNAYYQLSIVKPDYLKFISNNFKNFNQSSKTNINYLTILSEQSNIIPEKIFIILEKCTYKKENKEIIIIFDNCQDELIFKRWKSVFTINKNIYDSNESIIKKILFKKRPVV